MNLTESIIEKECDNRIMPHKPKPLCSCFIGDKMVDMYARFNFDVKIAGWSKSYKGHSNDKDFLDNMEVYDGDDDEVNKTIDRIDEYFRYHNLYLH